jgi:hypothetical protein
MKLEIELTDEQAACLWDDVTHGGQVPRTVAEIARDLLTSRAAKAIAYCPAPSRPEIVAQFLASQAPQPTQSRPDCDCGSGQASWHGEAPDLRQYCCPACYRARQAAAPHLPRTP